MKLEEKLRAMLKDYDRVEKNGAAIGEHLRDDDFMRLIENEYMAETNFLPNESGDAAAASDELAPLGRHLVACDSCLDQFKDFYAFFAPAQASESVFGKSEIDAAWLAFAPRIAEKRTKPNLWARIFPSERNPNFFAAFGWGFAALLLLFTGFTAFVAWQAKNENSQLAEQLERQKQTSEERLKIVERTARIQNLAEEEKSRLSEEKNELQKQVAQLQIEIERAKQAKQARENITSPSIPQNSSAEKPDDSLVAINTPIYDVFPGDAVVRGNQSANKFVVPNAAKNVVLILNAAGRADFPVYQAALVSGAGKIVWRGGGLRKDSTGNFTLTISRAALKTGNYQLKLSSGGQSVAEYPIAVEIVK